MQFKLVLVVLYWKSADTSSLFVCHSLTQKLVNDVFYTLSGVVGMEDYRIAINIHLQYEFKNNNHKNLNDILLQIL